MNDLNKIDQHTQFKLTNTIQKAATLAVASQRNPNEILAEQLKKSDIPKQLTKVATQAFNRRLSITKLAASKDDIKAQDFPLADVQRVQQLVGVSKIKKQASLNQAPFVFKITNKNMLKTASSDTQTEKEQQITIQQGLHKIQKYIDQSTITINNLRYQLQSDQVSLHNLVKKASEYLQRDRILSRQLSTIYGKAYTKLFSELPQPYLEKYASYSILKKTAATQLVQKAIKLFDVVQVKRLKLNKLANQLNDYCQKASAIQNQIKQQRINGLLKLSSGWSFGKQILANTVLNPSAVIYNASKDSAQFAASLGADLQDLASTQVVVSPQSALTAQLLAQDKYSDAKQALTLALAHPSTRNYKTRQIQRAVNDVLIQFPHYRSPRYAQHFLVAVKDRLAKGGQQNLAGMAAGAQLAKATSQADQTQRKARAIQAVKILSDQTSGRKTNVLRAIKNRLAEAKKLDYLYSDKDIMESFAQGVKQNIVQPIIQQSQQYMNRQNMIQQLKAMSQAQRQQYQQKYKKAVQAYLRNSISSQKPKGGSKKRKASKQQGHYGVAFNRLNNADARQLVVNKAQQRGQKLLTSHNLTSYRDLADALGLQLKSTSKEKENKTKGA